MEIQGISGKPAIAAKPETNNQATRADGASFLGSITEAVKAGKIVMPGGTNMEQLDFKKTKVNGETGIKAEETEEEKIKGFLTRIKNILDK